MPPVAALNQDGVLEFQNTGSLVAGLYEMTVVSGNVGKTDPDFRGFDAQIRVNTAKEAFRKGLSSAAELEAALVALEMPPDLAEAYVQYEIIKKTPPPGA